MADSNVMPMGLTAKERLFCEEYTVDFNGIMAAQRAGVPPSSAPSYALALLKRKDVRDEIRQLSAKSMGAHGLSGEMVVGELGLLAFSNMDDYVTVDEYGDPLFDFKKVSRRQMAAVAELTIEEYTEGKGIAARQIKKTRIKLHPKHEALVSLGKHYKIFNESELPKAIALILTQDELNA